MTKGNARIIGVVYFFFFLTSVLSEWFLKELVVANDAAATANHVLTHESSSGWALQPASSRPGCMSL